jgi:hypothetical protein
MSFDWPAALSRCDATLLAASYDPTGSVYPPSLTPAGHYDCIGHGDEDAGPHPAAVRAEFEPRHVISMGSCPTGWWSLLEHGYHVVKGVDRIILVDDPAPKR